MGLSALRRGVVTVAEGDPEAARTADVVAAADHRGVDEGFASSFTKDQAASCFSRSAFI